MGRQQTLVGAKFTRHFREIFNAEGLNAYAERWIQSIKHECLDHFVVFGEDHLNHLVSEYVAHFHTERAHQRLGNRSPLKQEAPEPGGRSTRGRSCAASGWAGC